MPHWPGGQVLQLVVRLADGRSGSPGESRTRYLCWSNGLPVPELQYDVWHDGRLVATVDFVWHAQRLIGEFDGRVKYGRLLRPGEEPGDAVWREKQREDLVRRLTGYRVVRFTWADLERPGVTAAVLRAALADAAA